MEKFSYETNGYNRSEVNQFISDVIRETEGIISKVRAQSSEIEELKKELEHYKNIENALNNAVMKADEAKADAGHQNGLDSLRDWGLGQDRVSQRVKGINK